MRWGMWSGKCWKVDGCSSVEGLEGQYYCMICNSSSVRCIEKIHTASHHRQTCLSFGATVEPPYLDTVALMRRDTEVLRSLSEIVKFHFYGK